jgi:hypothetical protein
LILETVIKLFVMQSAYAADEDLPASSCFSEAEQVCLEVQLPHLEFDAIFSSFLLAKDLSRR